MGARQDDEHDGVGRTRTRLLLNVDLEIESEHDLQPLIDEFKPVAYSLERPNGRACLELNSAITPDDPQPLILEFVRLVQALSSTARSSWDRASKRVFDIGFQSARQPFQETHRFAPHTLRALAEIGAELAITIYAPDSVNTDVAG
jgi:hypothetical protein